MKLTCWLFTLTTISIFSTGTSNVLADVVFVVNSNSLATPDRVVRIDSNGNNATTLWSNTTSTAPVPRGLAHDSVGNRVYWSDTITRDISSVSASNGSGFLSFNRNNGSTQSISIDSAAPKMYVYEAGNPTANEAITQMNLDGSSPVAFVPGPAISGNTWSTIASGFLYYSDNTDILRRSVDGLTTETIVAGSGDVRGIAVLNDDIYWLNNANDNVSRRSISNTLASVSTLALGTGSTPNGLTTDGQYLFYAEQAAVGNTAIRGINRFNPDLTGLVNLVSLTSAEIANGIAAVPEPSSIALAACALGTVVVARVRRKKVLLITNE